jgi:hypothetical protein
MKAAILFPIAAGVGLFGGWTLIAFSRWCAENAIEDWQVAWLAVAVFAAVGLVADRLIGALGGRGANG